MPRVNPEILVWARTTAALGVEEAARRLRLGDSKSTKAAEKLRALESGDREPSRTTLRHLETLYRRPLLAFYLDRPPAPHRPVADFRSRSHSRTPRDDARLDALLRDILARQSILREALREDEGTAPLPFVGAHRPEDCWRVVRRSLDRMLHSDRRRRVRHPRDRDSTFHRLRDRVESAGVFVLLRSDLGNDRTRLDPTIFRALAISDDSAPFLVINDRQPPARAIAHAAPRGRAPSPWPDLPLRRPGRERRRALLRPRGRRISAIERGTRPEEGPQNGSSSRYRCQPKESTRRAPDRRSPPAPRCRSAVAARSRPSSGRGAPASGADRRASEGRLTIDATVGGSGAPVAGTRRAGSFAVRGRPGRGIRSGVRSRPTVRTGEEIAGAAFPSHAFARRPDRARSSGPAACPGRRRGFPVSSTVGGEPVRSTRERSRGSPNCPIPRSRVPGR